MHGVTAVHTKHPEELSLLSFAFNLPIGMYQKAMQCSMTSDKNHVKNVDMTIHSKNKNFQLFLLPKNKISLKLTAQFKNDLHLDKTESQTASCFMPP